MSKLIYKLKKIYLKMTYDFNYIILEKILIIIN